MATTRINVSMGNGNISWNLKASQTTDSTKLQKDLEKATWIKVGSHALLRIDKIMQIRFFDDGDQVSCSEFELV